MFDWLSHRLGRWLARYLERPLRRYETFSLVDTRSLRALLQPGDVVLVEGRNRISVAIKYLTQSTWSHAAMYVGNALVPDPADGDPPDLIEALATDGVIAVPLSKYATFNLRICRPEGLDEPDRRRVVRFMVDSIGMRYDLKNVFDLMRYLLPTPPVPVNWRRRMLALGSGDPTRAICSTLIAQAFQSVRFPILPLVEQRAGALAGTPAAGELLHIRHHSLFTPRDFDLSPYFRTIKPGIESGFDYKTLRWADH